MRKLRRDWASTIDKVARHDERGALAVHGLHNPTPDIQAQRAPAIDALDERPAVPTKSPEVRVKYYCDSGHLAPNDQRSPRIILPTAETLIPNWFAISL